MLGPVPAAEEVIAAVDPDFVAEYTVFEATEAFVATV